VTRYDDALEQMRSANPVAGIGDVDVGELDLSRSHFEERRLAMKTRTPTPRDRIRTRPASRWRPVSVMASAFLLVVALLGAGTVVLRGSESDAPTAEEPVTTVVTTPTVTTVPEGVDAREATAIEPGVRVLSNLPEYGTNLVLGTDGLPVILSTTRSGDEYPGTARLFRCADVACDEFTVKAIDYEPGSGNALISAGAADALVVGPNGDVYIALESADAVHSVGRYNGDMVEPLPILSNWPSYQSPEGPTDPIPYMPLPTVFDDRGYPVFVTFHGAFPAAMNLLVCNDPLCADFIEVEFDSARFYDRFLEVSIDGDTAQIIYSIAEPTESLHPEETGKTESVGEVKVATISDLYGSPTVYVEIVDVDPRITHELDPQMRTVSAHIEEVYDSAEYSAYLEEVQRNADEGLVDVGVDDPDQLGVNIVVTRCSDTACTSVERITIAALETPWRHLGSLEIEVAPDGTVLVAVAGAGEYSESGLWLYVFPDGEFGPGVEPIAGHVIIGWDAR
jgi:hypothetical protein